VDKADVDPGAREDESTAAAAANPPCKNTLEGFMVVCGKCFEVAETETSTTEEAVLLG
jgi:hypothetical protein